ncbi:MAG: heavy metal-binding domain-containing protein, partial [Methanosphaera sp.]|nr:heavy metal-binding domain-containing protein [Methanosphaera sp.]
RDVVGGRTSTYEDQLKKARELAMQSMIEKAEDLEANAILNVRVKYSNLGGTMGNTILVSITGTAVKY